MAAMNQNRTLTKAEGARPSTSVTSAYKSTMNCTNAPTCAAARSLTSANTARTLAALVLAALLALFATGCANNQSASSADVVTSTAVVVGTSGTSVLMVDQDTQTPFIPTIPAEGIEIADGTMIQTVDLEPGNVIRIVGNGIMLESYPGQYPGITSMTLIEAGSPDDAAEYEDILTETFAPADEATVPSAFVEYDTDLGATTLALEAYSYNWQANGNENAEAAILDGAYADPSGIITDVVPPASIKGQTEAMISFDRGFQSIEVNRTMLDPDSISREFDDPNGPSVDLKSTQEPIEAETRSTGVASFEIIPGYVYTITVHFANGEASYAFITTEQ